MKSDQNNRNGKVSVRYSKMFLEVEKAVDEYTRHQPKWQRKTTTNLTPILKEMEEKRKRNNKGNGNL